MPAAATCAKAAAGDMLAAWAAAAAAAAAAAESPAGPSTPPAGLNPSRACVVAAAKSGVDACRPAAAAGGRPMLPCVSAAAAARAAAAAAAMDALTVESAWLAVLAPDTWLSSPAGPTVSSCCISSGCGGRITLMGGVHTTGG